MMADTIKTVLFHSNSGGWREFFIKIISSHFFNLKENSWYVNCKMVLLVSKLHVFIRGTLLSEA